MAVISRALISWKIDCDQVDHAADLDVVSVHQQGTELCICDTRTPQVSPRFSLGSINSSYAEALFSLFKEAIGDHLKETRPQQGCFLPLLLYPDSADISDQLALFGYTVNQSPPLQRWRWVIWNESSGSSTSFFVEDTHEQSRLQSLQMSDLSSLLFHERNQLLDIHVAKNPDGQINTVNLQFKREGSAGKDTLSRYLTNPIDPNHLIALKRLGLAPEQIEVFCTEDELHHFRAVMSSLQELPQPMANRVVDNLEKLYPTQFPILFKELVTARKAREGENAYLRIVEVLQQQVSGQDYARKAIAAALNAQAKSDSNAYFLLVGPTGVGKTEMAKAASILKRDRMARFDMDQFKGEVDCNKLFGSPAGYVGSTDRSLFARVMDSYVHKTSTRDGIIVKEVRDVVVLFDELEKAHQQVKQGLLTLFGEGYILVQHSEDRKNVVARYVFTKSLFMSTSNAYQAHIVADLQNMMSPQQIAVHFTELNAQDHRNPHRYSPELLGRLHMVPFSPIPRDAFPELVRRKLPFLLKSLHAKVGCETLTFSETHLDRIILHLSEELYGDGTGIRRLLQYFDHTIYQNICEQSETWGNFKDKEMTIILLGPGLGIACKETLYGKTVTEYEPIRLSRP